MIDVWEPWKPTVGQRVKVKVSPECPCWQVRSAVQGKELTGTYVDWVPPPAREWAHWHHSHNLCVQFDSPILFESGAHLVAAWFAAIELEPIDA